VDDPRSLGVTKPLLGQTSDVGEPGHDARDERAGAPAGPWVHHQIPRLVDDHDVLVDGHHLERHLGFGHERHRPLQRQGDLEPCADGEHDRALGLHGAVESDTAGRDEFGHHRPREPGQECDGAVEADPVERRRHLDVDDLGRVAHR
jgi:hypothetical protein